jgi:hypothetical protein
VKQSSTNACNSITARRHHTTNGEQKTRNKQNKKRKMTRGGLFWFVLCCVLFAAVVAVFITCLALPHKQSHLESDNAVFSGHAYNSKGLQQSFDQTIDGAFNLSSDARPYAITATRDGPIRPAFVYTNLVPPGGTSAAFVLETFSTARGFVFQVNLPVAVVALQVIDQFYDAGVRQVGIFDKSSQTLLAKASVSKSTDFVVNGFRTHALLPQEQILLTPGVDYVCVGLVQSGDYYEEAENVMYANNLVTFSGLVGSVTSGTLIAPTEFKSGFNTSPFAALQIQQKQIVNDVVWSVTTQLAELPPYFIVDCNVSTDANSVISVTSGYAESVFYESTLILQNDTALPFPPAASEVWYGVFVGAPDIVDVPIETRANNAQVFISANYVTAPQLQTTLCRRVGWVRTKPQSSDLWQMSQTGDSVRRTTQYKERAECFVSILDPNIPQQFLLALVPPNVSEVSFEIFVQQVGGFLPSSNFTVVFNDAYAVHCFGQQQFQIQNITIPIIDNDRIPLQIRLVSNASTNMQFQLSVTSFTEDL